MRFANAELAWVLLLIPLCAAVCWHRSRAANKKFLRFADADVLRVIDTGHSQARRQSLRFCFRQTAIVALLCLAALRPQWGYQWQESTRRGIDIVVAVDVSESMLAADISPTRLERARRELIDLLGTLRGDRIALVAFAGVAFVEAPLTLDYGTFRLFLQTLSPELIPVKGTNIEAALEESLDAFGREALGHSDSRSRAIILITDGEHFAGDLEKVTQRAAESGVRIYIIGIGSTEGSPIPTADGYKRDQEGNIVISRLNIKALENLATRTGGIFVTSISSDRDVKTIYDEGIRKVFEEQTYSGGRAKRWNEYFQLPLAAALLAFLLPLLNRRFGRTPLASAAAALALLTSCPARAELPENLGDEAAELYAAGKFEQAEARFRSGAEKEPEDYRFLLGQGAALYRLEDFAAASEAFLRSAAQAEQPAPKAFALYNAGNSFAQLTEYQRAIEVYEEALTHTPEDQEIKDNLEYVKRLLEEQQKQQQQDQQQQQEQQEEEQQEQQQQQQQQQGQGQDKNRERQGENEEQGKADQNQQDKSEQGAEDEKEQQSDGQGEDEKEQQSDGQGEDEKEQPEQQQQQEEQRDSGDKGQEDREQRREREQKQEQEQQQEQQDRSSDEAQDRGRGDSGSGDQPQTRPQSGSKELEALLGSVKEDRNPLYNFRRDRALEQLRELEQRPPEQDW